MNGKKIPLLFSDVSYGTHEYGFLPRKGSPDAEDVAYIRHINKTHPSLQVKCCDGYLFVTSKSSQ